MIRHVKKLLEGNQEVPSYSFCTDSPPADSHFSCKEQARLGKCRSSGCRATAISPAPDVVASAPTTRPTSSTLASNRWSGTRAATSRGWCRASVTRAAAAAQVWTPQGPAWPSGRPTLCSQSLIPWLPIIFNAFSASGADKVNKVLEGQLFAARSLIP
eukprot:jgi/Botrbrau1/8944/Bobra.0148s0057.1